MRLCWLPLAFVALLTSCARKEETLSHGRFEQVVVLQPEGTPRQVALLLTDRDGWNARARRAAKPLVEQGALVIGVPLPPFYAELQKETEGCEFVDGDLENLSHFVQAYYRLPTYTPPVLVGYGEGAAFAYANLAQAPADVFAGALTLGFCPQLQLKQALCAGEGLVSAPAGDGFALTPAAKLPAPWIALQDENDARCPLPQVRTFVTQTPRASISVQPAGGADLGAAPWQAALRGAFKKLAAAAPPTRPSVLADLPLIEIPAQVAQPTAPLAVFWSGDGGWAGLDRDVAEALSAQGVPVVGVDSLRYFWTARTPESVAADIDRIIQAYTQQWRREQVLLIGYSQGADVLPFAINRLSPTSRTRVRLAAAMGLSDHAVFEFHLSNWLADNNNGPETQPEVQKIQGIPFLCVYGEDEDDTICPKLSGPALRAVKLPGGHHFEGDYRRLAEEILKAAQPTPAAPAATPKKKPA